MNNWNDLKFSFVMSFVMAFSLCLILIPVFTGALVTSKMPVWFPFEEKDYPSTIQYASYSALIDFFYTFPTIIGAVIGIITNSYFVRKIFKKTKTKKKGSVKGK